MTNRTEQFLLESARREQPALPDFEAMWGRMQVGKAPANLTNRGVMGKIPLFTSRMRLLPVSIALSSVLVAAPVVAGVSLGWDEMFDRLGVSTALKSGFGNPLDITVQSAGASLAIKGVVTDEQRLDVLFSLDFPQMSNFDVAAFEQKTLTNSRGETLQLTDRIRKNASSGQLTGLLEAENGLGTKREQLEISLQNLLLYKYKETELRESPASLKEGQQIDSMTRYGNLDIVSVVRENEVLTVRYEIPMKQPNDQKLDPKLLLKVGGKTAAASYSAVLPPNKADAILRQDTFRLTDSELNSAKLYFNQLEVVQTIAGKWDASFEADGKRTSEATFYKKLDPAVVANDSNMELKQLVVTPLNIRIMMDDKWKTKSSYDSSVYYDKIELFINGQIIPGGRWEHKKGQFLNFELPEWYKDWSAIPMKLLLSEARISKRSKDLLPLAGLSDAKQSIQTSLDGIAVSFTYYKQGQDLIVESQSSDPKFFGISQSSVVKDGKPIYPEMNPVPPGGNGTNKRVERYPGLLSKQGELQLNPGFYSYWDKERKVEININ
ncbi:DUF4179 domain-containing protein [Paenibacillus sp. FSL H7-0331]|uniref:DUF4179 domain-containing protein n=1 Tax=Paenibacillus sp. FSL H7-0331 TaxID=1920421 RepID=UPI00096EC697|nr:DUF4179 domain-containing protein [Paenibacillus sp. FSL H7-0331]OMF08807.1 RNA polymerase subunit sigma [Paenibacillus sp. FSL H7-0331]